MKPNHTLVKCSWTVCVKYLPATNSQGSRFKAFRSDKGLNGKRESITVSFDYSTNTPEDTALFAFIDKFKGHFTWLKEGHKWAKGRSHDGTYTYSAIFE
jgi:hypothetical protein